LERGRKEGRLAGKLMRSEKAVPVGFLGLLGKKNRPKETMEVPWTCLNVPEKNKNTPT